jgi:N-acetyltransferase 10
VIHRYAIDAGETDWADAERQIRNAQKDGVTNKTVSVKTGSSAKRKAGSALEEAHKEVEKIKGAPKKRSKSGKGK